MSSFWLEFIKSSIFFFVKSFHKSSHHQGDFCLISRGGVLVGKEEMQDPRYRGMI